jgi:hypothetical protein
MPSRLTCPKRPRGQAAVESAIVLPLFVFLVLALVQLGLLNQAQLMTKYAAYRAARAGSLRSARHSVMRRAAHRALLPFLVVGSPGGGEHALTVATVDEFAARWDRLRYDGFLDHSRGDDERTQRHLDVRICSPTTDMVEYHENFDDPETVERGGEFGGGWTRWNKTRLHVQVSLYYRMPIPFANGILWWISSGEEDQESLRVLRMHGPPSNTVAAPANPEDFDGEEANLLLQDFLPLALRGIYVLPLRASYGLRMQSDFLGQRDVAHTPDFELPTSNRCVVPWRKRS